MKEIEIGETQNIGNIILSREFCVNIILYIAVTSSVY